MSPLLEHKKPESHLNAEQKLLTVLVPGNLVSTTVEALRNAVNSLLDWPAGQPVPWQTLKLDLTAARMVDSAGLNLVVAILRAVRRVGGRMQVAYSDTNVHRTLVFTRLDRHVELIKA